MLNRRKGFVAAGFRWWRKLDLFLLGEREIHALPRRVSAALEEQQKQSEVVISLLQVLIVGGFSILYILSPSTAPEDAIIEPVPWALGLWFFLPLSD